MCPKTIEKYLKYTAVRTFNFESGTVAGQILLPRNKRRLSLCWLSGTANDHTIKIVGEDGTYIFFSINATTLENIITIQDVGIALQGAVQEIVGNTQAFSLTEVCYLDGFFD